MKILLHSACDDGYLPLLLEMMESLGEQLQKYDFGLLDLGLSDTNKDKIRKLKPDVIFKKAKWFLDLPEYRKNKFSQATAARPFIKEIFPNYDGYMQMDVDLWFLDNSAIDDYIKAAKKTGFAIISEWHPLLAKCLYYSPKKKKWYRIKSKPQVTLGYSNIIKNLFGLKATFAVGIPTPICCGLYFLHASSPIWEAWQNAMQKVNWYKVSKKQRTCDQTCLLYALTADANLPRTYMMMEHNWILFPELNKPLLDKKNMNLLDPVYPHAPIKVLHIGGSQVKNEFTLKTTDGGSITTKLTRTEFLKAVS